VAELQVLPDAQAAPAAPPPWAAPARAVAPAEEPAWPRAERFAREQLGLQDALAAELLPASAAAQRVLAPLAGSEAQPKAAALLVLRERPAELRPAAQPRACFPPQTARRA